MPTKRKFEVNWELIATISIYALGCYLVIKLLIR
jgi:hypothetical protein